ncbi:hypothetical protein ACFV0R_12975 [Streptomyces sp. NPDC059578]|uniref:hypothetical protein n=1 Tax=unclassified Streptomyces TaxID=2593676 RepID=UPI00365A6A22
MTVVVDASSEFAATGSPERQRDKVLAVVDSVGGHAMAWAAAREVSGANDLMTRPKLGPWDLDDPNDESRFTTGAWGAQMELRAMQHRNREESV